jgi:hypothetical protein
MTQTTVIFIKGMDGPERFRELCSLNGPDGPLAGQSLEIVVDGVLDDTIITGPVTIHSNTTLTGTTGTGHFRGAFRP